jgi:hypothetical protein
MATYTGTDRKGQHLARLRRIEGQVRGRHHPPGPVLTGRGR